MGQRRPVVQISPEYDVIAEFPWCGVAAEKCGVCRSFITDRVYPKKRAKFNDEFSAGFSFRYADDPEFLEKRRTVARQRVTAKDYVMEHISEKDLLLLMMEECSEMIQACAKRIRSTTKGNPTPVKPKEALAKMSEESGDVLMIMELFGYVPDGTTADNPKWLRWAVRLGYKEESA